MKIPSTNERFTVISVESRKGGVGKTTAALVLANLLVERGHPVLFIDADLTGTNTGHAVQDSPVWHGRTKVVNIPNNNVCQKGNQDVLLELFDAFVTGTPPAQLLGDGLDLGNNHKQFVVIGSRLLAQDKAAHRSPAVLFDDLHSYWFCVFLEELCATFARKAIQQNMTKSAVIVIDNSPGFTGIAPALHDWLTDLGPNRGKFLTITSPDSQDMAACGESVEAIHCRLQMKSKVAAWAYLVEQDKGAMSQDSLNDEEVNFLVRLMEGRPTDPKKAAKLKNGPLDYYLHLMVEGCKDVSVAQYQGLIINKVFSLLVEKSIEWTPEKLFENKAAARALLFPTEGIRRRLVEYDEHLELQFSQHLLRKPASRTSPEKPVVQRLRDLLEKLPRGVSMPTTLREKTIEVPEIELALRNCRRSFMVLHNYIVRSVRILDENGFEYISRLVRPEWYPRHFLETLRATFINAIARHREIPLSRGGSDIPLRLKPDGDHELTRLLREFHKAGRRPVQQPYPAFINSALMVVGMALVDFFHEDDWTHSIRKTIALMTTHQAEAFTMMSDHDQALSPSAFLLRQSAMGANEIAERFKQDSVASDAIARDIYPVMCRAQARCLDLEADAKLLGWAIIEAASMESEFRGMEIFLPDLRGLLDPVIVEKSMTHLKAREQASQMLHGASYLKRFSIPLSEILDIWKIKS